MSNKGRAEATAPMHPGAFIRSAILPALGLSVSEAALALGITRTALSAFLNTRASLSTEMALRLEKAFNVRIESTMMMQCLYDIAEARKREGEIALARYAPAFLPGEQPKLL